MRPSEAADMAREALARGEPTLARSITERLLGEFARYPPARLMRALLSEQANETDAALDDLRAVTSAEPTNAEARAAQARLFQRRGDTDRARMAARLALDLIPTDPNVLGSALEVLGVDVNSLETSAAVLARVHLNCGWPDLAERHARVAISESPERVDVRLTLAEALWRLGRLPACEAECRVVADQAEECVRAAVMRAHILSERGRTAEGQELLDRIGRIDPEFREARELLGALEVHRLVLPDGAGITLPPELLGKYNGAMPSADTQSPPDETKPMPVVADSHQAPPVDGRSALVEGPAKTPVEQPESDAGSGASQDGDAQVASAVAGSESPSAAPQDDRTDDRGQARRLPDDPAVSTAQPRLADAAAEPVSREDPAPRAAQVAPVDADVTAIPGPDPNEAAPAASFSTFDWARHLIQQSEWTEAERVLTDIVTANDSDISRVDGLLLEAVAHRELRRSVWKLLGDHYMQTGRPQAAADAYLRAANVAGRLTQ